MKTFARAGFAESNSYKRLFDASFVLCRAPASAPAVRICSTVSALEGGVARVVTLICGGGCGVTFAAFAAVVFGGACSITFATVVAAISGGAWGVTFATFVAATCGGGCGVMFAATTPPLIS